MMRWPGWSKLQTTRIHGPPSPRRPPRSGRSAAAVPYPVAAYARVEGDEMAMHGVVSDGDMRLVRAEAHGGRADPVRVGRELARRLAEAGAADILAGLS